MFRRLLYTSHAAEGVDSRQVFDIIRTSHNRNSRAGLTGGLLFVDGYFYQLLEGLRGAVEQRYDRIAADPRHHSVELRLDETADEPIFANDWMALRDASQIDDSILAHFGCSPGSPPEAMQDDQVFEFLLTCFEKEIVHC